jgi:hypothetical protein
MNRHIDALRTLHRMLDTACDDITTELDRGMFALATLPVHEATRLHNTMLRIEQSLEGCEAILQGIIDNTTTTEG